MNNYIGKTCPYCKTEFKEGDDIVVCSSCDMPHHKDCWIENQGCTTFGCMGTIKSADGGANTVTATEISFDDTSSSSHVFCTKCGAQNSSESSFCSKCGNSLRATSSAPVYTQANPANTNPYAYTQQNYNPQPTYTQPTYTQPYQQNNYYNQNNTYGQQNYYSQNAGAIDADVVAMVGTKQEYYIPKFQQMKTQNKKTSWNWVAFFFTPYWFMYRKMYGYGFATLGVAFLITLINAPIFSFLSLGGYITMGIFANYIYMQWLEKHANQVKTMNEPFRTQFIQKNGGVNSIALTLTIIGWVILVGLVSAM